MTTSRPHWVALGSLLLAAKDQCVAAELLHAYLSRPSGDLERAIRESGMSKENIDRLRSLLPSDHFELARLCEMAAAWSLGHRDAGPRDAWWPVITHPTGTTQAMDRLTGETIIGLIAEARSIIRLFSAFVDAGGIESISFPLAAATRRGVTVAFGFRANSDRRGESAAILRRSMSRDGESSRFSLAMVSDEVTFPHLKLVTVDGVAAYIGSANLTYSALAMNVEVGALVRGPQVARYERVFDELVANA